MKKRVLVLMAMVLLLMLAMSVNDVIARTGGSGEGDDCLACWITEDVNPVYQGPLLGWQDTTGAVWLCSPSDNKGNVIPLSRGGKTKCEMVIPCSSPYKVGVFERKPETPSDIRGFCRSGLTMYDTCSYPVIVSAFQVIDSSAPNYIDENTFTINVKMMPLTITNDPFCTN